MALLNQGCTMVPSTLLKPALDTYLDMQWLLAKALYSLMATIWANTGTSARSKPFIYPPYGSIKDLTR